MTRHVLADSPSALDIDLDAIAENTRHVRALVGPGRDLYAALKCDAYGLGLLPVARTILDAGADAIAVARLGDALALRSAGIRSPIVLYPAEPFTPAVVHAVEAHAVTPTVWDEDSARAISAHATHDIPVMLKVDVGLRRLGVDPGQAAAVGTSIARLPRLVLDGVLTHLHVPPDPVRAGYLEWQFGRFSAVINELAAAGVPVRVQLAASSAVLRLTATMNLTAVDPGRLYLGLVEPGPGTGEVAWRSGVAAFRSRLIAVKEVEPDEFSDYAQIPIGRGVRLGVIPLGYADGLARSVGRQVLVRGRRVPAFPALSLEHCRVDLTEVPEASVGDEVVLIGSQGGEEITVNDVAQALSLPAVAVPVAIGPSVPRVYRAQSVRSGPGEEAVAVTSDRGVAGGASDRWRAE